MKEFVRKYGIMAGILLAIFGITSLAGFVFAQKLSVMIIGFLITATFLFWNRRVAFALLGVGSLLIFHVLDIPHLLEFASFDIILFLIGMMIVMGYLERAKFFDVLIAKTVYKSNIRGELLLMLILFLSMVSAALVDEVTSILIMTSIILHICSKLEVNPVPFFLMVVFATNIGSSATLVGNPVGVLIALKAGLTFTDFLRWATPISIIAFIACMVVCRLYFYRPIKEFSQKLRQHKGHDLGGHIPESKMIISTALFSFLVCGLIFHAKIEKLFGLEKNTLLVGMALLCAGIALMLARDGAREIVERKVDWWTLTFFIFLFASVGSLEYTGVIHKVTSGVQSIVGENLLFALIFILLLVGLLSAVLDNILAVAIIAPVVSDLMVSMGQGTQALWWSLLFGGTFFGNMTHIGSTANIVALGILQKHNFGVIGFKQWIIPGLLVTLVTATVAILALVFQLPLMP